MEERTDHELVALARNGDKDAFGVLAQRYQMTARRFAMRLVEKEDSAQELAQEAMLQAYLSLDRLRDPARFKSWLCGIVLNVCRSHLRDREITFFSLEAMLGGLQFYAVPFFSVPVTPEKIAEERELHRIVLDAINALAPRDRDATLLFYYAQLSLQEIAALLDISVGAVKVRLHRARQRLKEKLLSQHPEIVPREKRRKIMVRVTIADIVKAEQKGEQGHPWAQYVIILCDESGKRALPIWIGPHEGEIIAIGLNEFSTPRPLTFNFFVSLLQVINAEVEQVRVETLKENIFYAIVKVRCGKKVSELDARPSDAIALAVLTGSPIFAAEDVLERAGADIPPTAKVAPERKGVASILREIEEIQRQMRAQFRRTLSPEELARARDKTIASVFSG